MSAPTAEQLQQVGAWIRSEAATRSVEDTQAYVVERLARLRRLAESFSPAELTAVNEREGWSPLQAVKHVVEWNWHAAEEVLHVSLMGERPDNPVPEFPADLPELMRRAEESLDSLYAHVSAADPAAFLDLTWEHPFFGQLNWREWHLFLGVHYVDHATQLTSMRESAGA